MWQFTAVDAVTRLPIVRNLPVRADWSATVKLNAWGEGTFPVQVNDLTRALTPGEKRLLYREGLSTVIVVEWVNEGPRWVAGQSTIVYEGFVTVPEYRPLEGVLTLHTRSFRWLLSCRFLDRLSSWGDNERWLFPNRTVPELAGSIITLATGNRLDATNPRWWTPISVIADADGARRDFVFPKRALLAEEVLAEVQGYEQFDIDFRAWWDTAGGLRWTGYAKRQIEHWTVRLPVDPTPGAQSQVVDLGMQLDSLEKATGVVAEGNGVGRSKLVSMASYADIGVSLADIEGLYVDKRTQAPNVESQAELEGFARTWMRERVNATSQWSFAVQADAEDEPFRFRPGVSLLVDWAGDDLVAAMLGEFLIVSATYGASWRVSLEVQPRA